MLYVPGCSTRYLNKSRTLKVDSVILDLGDPILVEAKVESRRNVVEAVLAGGFGRREVVVRVNDLDSPWGEEDVKAVAHRGRRRPLPERRVEGRRGPGAVPARCAGGGTCRSW
jgi:citrate lyase subunit beta/citryl-CoA lyase